MTFKTTALLTILTLFLAGTVIAMESQEAESEVYVLNTFEEYSGGFHLALENSAQSPLELLEQGAAEEQDGSSGLVFGRFFRLPPRGSAELTVNQLEFSPPQTVDLDAFLTASGMLDVVGELDSNEDRWLPEEVVVLGEPAIMRDFRVATLNAIPCQLNPATGQVRTIEQLDVSVQFTDQPGENELESWPTQISEMFLPYYRGFLDWSESELDQYEVVRGGMVVVTKTNALPLLADWIEWKQMKGWDLQFVTDDDVSWSIGGISGGIQDVWDSSEIPFDHIVVIGDNTGIYATPASEERGWNGAGDVDYARLAGSDYLPDCTVGRISVESQVQLVAYVNKVLSYEKEPYMGETDWYLRGAVAAGSASSGLSTIMVGRYARQAMYALGYTQVDTAWYNDGQGNVNERDIVALNNGVSFFSYRGYIGSGLNTGQIGNLNNTDMLPMVLDITCGTGTWTNNYSLTEAWMRGGTANEPRAGIAAIGTATSGTHTRYNNSLAGGAIESVLVRRNPTIGEAWLGAQYNLFRAYWGFANSSVRDFAVWCNLMGDPTVYLFTDIPQDLTVEANTAASLGTNSLEVSVTNGSGPLGGAWVTLYKMGEDEEIIARGETDPAGHVVLHAPVQFAGTANLTVTAQNHHPEILDIVYQEEQSLGYDTLEIVDDGSQGTSGNGNGMADVGETVGLRLTAKGYGTGDFANATASISILDEEGFDSVSGDQTFGTVNSGDEVASSTLTLVDIAATANDGFIGALEVIFQADGGYESQDLLQLEVHAPEYAVNGFDTDQSPTPGTTTQLDLTLGNIGSSNGVAGTARLTSQHPFLMVTDSMVELPTIPAGGDEEVGPFTIAVHDSAFSGFSNPLRLILTLDNGHVDTTYMELPLGSASSNDPVGPDGYGYVAYDNRDTGYGLAPQYDWVEISTMAPDPDYNGTLLPLNDNNEDEDACVRVDLPFEFQYYGEVFDEITIGSNGYIAMGDQSDLAFARNWPIPAPLGPNYMIAPFWDDRVFESGSSGVFTYYDEPNGRFIVEWYNTKDLAWGGPGTSTCTFQLMLYDQVDGHYTFTGDGEIYFQYSQVSPSSGQHFDNDYFTTGIENGDQSDGLQIVYWNQPGGEVVANRAIRITTLMQMIVGSLEGTVTLADGGAPVEGAEISINGSRLLTTTDEDGYYFVERVMIGEHDFRVEGTGINPMVIPGVVIEEEQTTELDFSVAHPEFSLDLDEIVGDLDTQSEVVVPITITNDGDGPLDYTIDIDFWGPDGETANAVNPGDVGPAVDELDEPWELLFEFLTDPVETRYRGVSSDVEHFWLSGANNSDSDGANKLYKYSLEGELLGTYDQPVAEPSSAGFYSLSYDGEYLYGVDDARMHQMDVSGDEPVLVDSWEVPVNPARYMAYDWNEDIFWMGDMTTDIQGFDRSGQEVASWQHDLDLQAIAWFPEDPEGYHLYLGEHGVTDDEITLHKMNTNTGQLVEVTTLSTGDRFLSDFEISYAWNPMVWALVCMMDGGLDQDAVRFFEVAINSAWMELSHQSGQVPAGSQETVNLTLRSLDIPDGTYESWLRFDHTAHDQVAYLPVQLTILSDVEEDPAGTVSPLEWSFDGAYPNPFNPQSTVAFSLKEATHVRASLYNVLGQRVLQIADQEMRAGKHQVMVDGRALSSGLYFLTFEAGPMHVTRKLVLMK